MNLITINNVRGFIDESGTAQLNLEDVSRGLGFTTVATSGNEVIRWSRVNGYLSEMGFPQLVGKEFIPENVFYRLSMKAKNETAEKFQIIVADEILPSIRKTGTYSVQPKFNLPQSMPEALRLLAAEMEEKETIKAEKAQLTIETTEQKQRLKEQQEPVAIYNLAISARNYQSMAEVAKALGTGRNRMFDFLRDEGVIIKNSRIPYQRFIDSGHFVVRERPRASGDAIINDPVTKVTAKGFEMIAKRWLAKKEQNSGKSLQPMV